jgi:hypothetical protein
MKSAGTRKRRKILVDVACPDCGKVRKRERRDLNRYSHYCRSCIQSRKPQSTYSTGRSAHNEETKKIYLANPFDPENLKVLPSEKLRRIHKSAIGRGIAWTLSAEFLDDLFLSQRGRCALSGLPLFLGYGEHSISIDRVDSSLGYSPGNVQLVVKEVNVMKHELSNEDFRHICRLVSMYVHDPSADLIINRPAKQQHAHYAGQQKYDFDGESLTIPEWELKLGFKPGVLENRFEKGWTLERALTEKLGKSDGNRHQRREHKRQKQIHFNGQTMNMSQWEYQLGFKQHTIKQRLKKGWTIERALTEPVVQGKNQSSPESRAHSKTSQKKGKVRPGKKR